ncbi:NADPH-dependent 7-cyano-7-deazaguanine reductase QueF [Marinomonas agarivorans]|nr:NADPH-dependent 7-cyano-7-deazaguanine reductase QueF [Marinomonas agarivorans]
MGLSPLGQKTDYVSHYDPALLYPIARDEKWREMSLNSANLPFYGEDIWNAYELSWLDSQGKPIVKIAEFRFPYDSPNIIESKSFKLYLNSFNQTSFADCGAVTERLQEDLSLASGAVVDVVLYGLEAMETLINQIPYYCIDDLPISTTLYHPQADLLEQAQEAGEVEEQLVSHLLKSNCPVTNQPDWGSVFIDYQGPQIQHESLLKYIISFREHTDFHEQCVERIFMDIMSQCKPKKLTVYARYVRRGGLDINPYRSTQQDKLSNTRLSRQ